MTLRRWISIMLLCAMLVGCGNPWSSGDRVLVSKCAYDSGLAGPERYDVVVFKYPGSRVGDGPVKNGTPVNYIKRLLGLPGELLAIFFGRIYRWTPPENAALPFDDLKDGKFDANQLRDAAFMHTNDEKSRQWFEAGKFDILRKPPKAMLSMRRIVFDNDYQPSDLKNFARWNPKAGSNWKADGETRFQHEGQPEGAIDWLHYRHMVRKEKFPDEASAMLITDSMAYNHTKNLPGRDDNDRRPAGPERSDRSPPHQHWVGDLMIECDVNVLAAGGEFCLELNKGPSRYQACWDLASGECKLKSIDLAGKETPLGSAATSAKGPGNYMLRFANIDARLTVWVGSSLPFDKGVDYPDGLLKRDGPQPNDLNKPASIGSKGAKVKVSHIRLWRDTYYTAMAGLSNPDYAVSREDFGDSTKWKPIRDAQFATRYVQPGHYLCLGDNSQQSSDSRDWGLVPERLMLGRALVVYYPLDRIGFIR